MDIYEKCPEAGNSFRTAMLKEAKTLVRTERRKADRRRKQYFTPDFSSIDAYEQSTAKYREELKAMLGWPLTERWSTDVHSASTQSIAEDSLGPEKNFIKQLLGNNRIPSMHGIGER